MSDLMFSCPHCAAELECEERFGGQEMQCPTCQGVLLTPQAQSRPAPPPAPSSPRGGGPVRSPRGGSASKSRQKKAAGREGAAKVLKIVAIVALLGLVFYVGFGYAKQWQDKFNKKQAELVKESDGGQLGHIANIYAVLDATDPSKNEGMFYGQTPNMGGEGGFGSGSGPGNAEAASNEMRNMPVVPPVHSLDVSGVTIPNGKVNGTISGTNFVVETARVGLAQPYHVLSVRQGEGPNPDREILVFFLVNPGETLAGHKVTIASDQTGKTLPKITKRWKTNPKYAPHQKSYGAGYSLVLEFGQSNGTCIPGEMYVALPDEEKTVVAGRFYADLLIGTSRLNGGDY